MWPIFATMTSMLSNATEETACAMEQKAMYLRQNCAGPQSHVYSRNTRKNEHLPKGSPQLKYLLSMQTVFTPCFLIKTDWQ